MDSPITIDPQVIQRLVNQAVEDNILSAVENLSLDSAWLSKVEHMINQAVVQRTVATLNQTDISLVIQKRVDENMDKIRTDLIQNFSSTGIIDQATETQIAITDESTNIKNCVITNSIEVLDSISVKNLSVIGSINVDNPTWDGLATHISQRTLDALSDLWRDQLIQDVSSKIKDGGINFDQILVGGQKLVDGNQLSGSITESNLQSVGTLKTLKVSGESHINNNTLNVLNKRLGINTETPEMALSIWDEEVSIVIGKNKANEAYLGTNRDQGIAIGINRKPQIELDTSGLTRIKKLQIGLHKISHSTEVPGWSGTRGDIVFNANPGSDRVFAWVCIGGFNWQVLKSAE